MDSGHTYNFHGEIADENLNQLQELHGLRLRFVVLMHEYYKPLFIDSSKIESFYYYEG